MHARGEQIGGAGRFLAVVRLPPQGQTISCANSNHTQPTQPGSTNLNKVEYYEDENRKLAPAPASTQRTEDSETTEGLRSSGPADTPERATGPKEPDQTQALPGSKQRPGVPTPKLDSNEVLPTPGESSPVVTYTPTLSPASRGIRLGTRVRLRPGHMIHHKLRQYGNTEAFVVNVPVHPNTWVGVQLCDGNTVKIRKSAFDILEPGESVPKMSLGEAEAAKGTHPPRRSFAVRRPSRARFSPAALSQESDSDSGTTYSEKRTVQRRRPKSKNGRNLVGQYVVVEAGRGKGETGFVLRGGNGYYCVELSHKLGDGGSRPGNQVMKRSSDLRLLTEERRPVHVERKRPRANSEDLRPVRKRSRTTTKESWMNRCVFVKTGKFQGETGIVRRSGHGFYGVEIEGHGEVMKRAMELELYDEDEEEEIDTKKDEGVRDAAAILLEIQRQRYGWSAAASPARAFVLERTQQEMARRRDGSTHGWTTSAQWHPPSPVQMAAPREGNEQEALPAFVMRVTPVKEHVRPIARAVTPQSVLEMAAPHHTYCAAVREGTFLPFQAAPVSSMC